MICPHCKKSFLIPEEQNPFKNNNLIGKKIIVFYITHPDYDREGTVEECIDILKECPDYIGDYNFTYKIKDKNGNYFYCPEHWFKVIG